MCQAMPEFLFFFRFGNMETTFRRSSPNESSRLSFVHVLVAVRDCQVDSITNRAMPCRLSSVDFDHGF